MAKRKMRYITAEIPVYYNEGESWQEAFRAVVPNGSLMKSATVEYEALGMSYYPWDLKLAESRGWSHFEHQAALDSGDEDQIALTHPTNWLTESEVEDV